MSGLNYYSDYGSGSSSNSSSTWPTQETWSNQTNLRHSRSIEQKSASFQDLVMGKCTLEDIMKEFEMNGSDSPYTPDEDRIWGNPAASLCGMGPSSAYVRQKSWPEPERSPAPRLPRAPPAPPAPPADWSSALEFTPKEFTSTSTPVEEPPAAPSPALTAEQLAALHTLPNAALFALLHDLELSRDGYRRGKRLSSECRFCKNNGERECYYRSHSLKDGAGRVTCPVLRAFVCARCGASGDRAHTIKYCPLSTTDERLKSAAMLRSVRLASGRRRAGPTAAAAQDYVMFGDATPSVVADTNAYGSYATSASPLDPLWAALEQKLLL